MRIGIGYDVHKLVEGRKLILGGVEIPYEKRRKSGPGKIKTPNESYKKMDG